MDTTIAIVAIIAAIGACLLSLLTHVKSSKCCNAELITTQPLENDNKHNPIIDAVNIIKEASALLPHEQQHNEDLLK